MQRHYKAARGRVPIAKKEQLGIRQKRVTRQEIGAWTILQSLDFNHLAGGLKTAQQAVMNINPLSGTNNTYLQSILAAQLSGAGSTRANAGSASAGSVASTQDTNQLSPFAQVLSTLQTLQQTNPTEYQQITQQIAANLQTASTTATGDGNTAAATQLTQLATDFTSASQNGQLPNIQDLSQAVSSGHHHHHGHHVEASTSTSNSDSTTGASTTTSSSAATPTSSTTSTNSATTLANAISQFLSNAVTGTFGQSNSLNPMTIIMNTLSNAGITLNS